MNNESTTPPLSRRRALATGFAAVAAASGLASGSEGGRLSGAGSGVGGAPAASTLSEGWPLSLRSNCRPKRTEGSTKAESAANGTFMRSCCLLKLTVTSKVSGPMMRSQYWCWRTIVISSGYLARR